ncbi:hypothetical protein D3C73_1294910 [compost metagenome]
MYAKGMSTRAISGYNVDVDPSAGHTAPQQTIDRFQDEEGFNVIIMSPIAAGVDLNITKANHIIHYTRHWNPAKEE